MANWDTLINTVISTIKTNNSQQITGANLQDVLLTIITSIGENATYAGIANLDTDPGAPEGPVFYIATIAGIYPFFNGLEVPAGQAVIFEWDGSTWSKKITGLTTQEELSKLSSYTLGEVRTFEQADYIGSAYLNADGTWTTGNGFLVCYYKVNKGHFINVEANTNNNAIIAFLDGTDNSNFVVDSTRQIVTKGTIKSFIAPQDCYLYVAHTNGANIVFPDRLSIYNKNRIDLIEQYINELKENEGETTITTTYSKEAIEKMTPYYDGYVLTIPSIDEEDITGFNISSVPTGTLDNASVFRIELPQSKCTVRYPLIKTTTGTGCVVTDKDDKVIWSHSEFDLDTGTAKEVTFDENAAYFYLSVTPTLKAMNYSFEVESKKASSSESARKNTKVCWLPFKPSIAGEKKSLCLAGIQFKIEKNKIPFQSLYLFHDMPDGKEIYIGSTLDNAEPLTTVDYEPKDYVMSLSPSGCIISVARDTRGPIRVWNGENHTVDAISTDELLAKPKGWLYNSGVEFIIDSDNTEHCLFAEYSGTFSTGQKMYVWKGTYPYTSPSNWKIVHTATTDHNDTYTAATGGSITHFHMVRRDPWTDILYLSSGDLPGQLQWWYSLDEGESWVLLASDGWDPATDVGFEEHCLRTINFIFTKDYIYWATDHGTNHTLNRVSRNAETGIIDPSTRVKLADLPYGQATNSLCYVESPNGLFLFERIDTGYPSSYASPIKVLFWSFEKEKLEILIELEQVEKNWGGHRGKCYFNYTNGAEPRPAMGFADNTRFPFDLVGSNEDIGTIYYEL